jgi:hypothetical protein
LYASRTLPHVCPTASTAFSTAPQLDAFGMISKSLFVCAKECIGSVKSPNVKMVSKSFFIDEIIKG